MSAALHLLKSFVKSVLQTNLYVFTAAETSAHLLKATKLSVHQSFDKKAKDDRESVKFVLTQ